MSWVAIMVSYFLRCQKWEWLFKTIFKALWLLHVILYPTRTLFSCLFGRSSGFNQKTLEEMTEVQVKMKPHFMKSFRSQAGFEHSAILCLELLSCQEEAALRIPFLFPPPPSQLECEWVETRQSQKPLNISGRYWDLRTGAFCQSQLTIVGYWVTSGITQSLRINCLKAEFPPTTYKGVHYGLFPSHQNTIPTANAREHCVSRTIWTWASGRERQTHNLKGKIRQPSEAPGGHAAIVYPQTKGFGF